MTDVDNSGQPIQPDPYDSTAEPIRPPSEFRPGQAQVRWPEPWETAQRLGRVAEPLPRRRPAPPYNSLERPERPFEEAGPPPAESVQPDRSWVPWLIIVGALIIVLVGAGIVLRSSNKVPAAVPVLGRDPGVDLCVGIASGDKAPTGAEGGKPMTAEEYRATRDAMGKIRNEDVRSGVVSIVDMAWALQATPGLALAMGGDIATAYGRLTTGCATYGVTLPPMNTGTTN